MEKTTNCVVLLNRVFNYIGVSKGYMLIATKNNTLYKWIYDHEESLKDPYSIHSFEQPNIQRIFCEPQGNHILIVIENKGIKYALYLNNKSTKFKNLTALKNINILSVAWNENSTENSTKEILLGDSGGDIYKLQINFDTKYETIKIEAFAKLINLSNQPIYGIAVSY